MSKPVKIVWMHLKNSKGVVDIEFTPKQSGVNVLGGKSGQGKTAFLDNVCWTIGGEKHRPSKAQRDDTTEYPDLDVLFDNGIRATRKGKRSSLKVVDTNNRLGNQTMLNEFVGSFALDAPKFLRLSAKDKGEALLNIIGVGDELRKLDKQHDELYAEREAHGRVTTAKEKYAQELPKHDDTPDVEQSATEIIEKIRAIDKQNAENDKRRNDANGFAARFRRNEEEAEHLSQQINRQDQEHKQLIADLERQLAEAKDNSIQAAAANADDLQVAMELRDSSLRDSEEARAFADKLTDQSTDDLNQQLTDCEAINARVRANAEKTAATDEAKHLRSQYVEQTGGVEGVRAKRMALLDTATLPLDGLGIERGELTYKGMPWDSMATSDQMKVATAIAAAENPKCGFVLLDGLETMDVDTLAEFNEWAEGEELQILGTRVSVGDECSLIIEAGEVKD